MKKKKSILYILLLTTVIGFLFCDRLIADSSLFSEPKYIMVTETGADSGIITEILLDEDCREFEDISEAIRNTGFTETEKSFDSKTEGSYITVSWYERKRKVGGLYWQQADPAIFYVHYDSIKGYFTMDDESCRKQLTETIRFLVEK